MCHEPPNDIWLTAWHDLAACCVVTLQDAVSRGVISRLVSELLPAAESLLSPDFDCAVKLKLRCFAACHALLLLPLLLQVLVGAHSVRAVSTISLHSCWGTDSSRSSQQPAPFRAMSAGRGAVRQLHVASLSGLLQRPLSS